VNILHKFFKDIANSESYKKNKSAFASFDRHMSKIEGYPADIENTIKLTKETMSFEAADKRREEREKREKEEKEQEEKEKERKKREAREKKEREKEEKTREEKEEKEQDPKKNKDWFKIPRNARILIEKYLDLLKNRSEMRSFAYAHYGTELNPTEMTEWEKLSKQESELKGSCESYANRLHEDMNLLDKLEGIDETLSALFFKALGTSTIYIDEKIDETIIPKYETLVSDIFKGIPTDAGKDGITKVQQAGLNKLKEINDIIEKMPETPRKEPAIREFMALKVLIYNKAKELIESNNKKVVYPDAWSTLYSNLADAVRKHAPKYFNFKA